MTMKRLKRYEDERYYIRKMREDIRKFLQARMMV